MCEGGYQVSVVLDRKAGSEFKWIVTYIRLLPWDHYLTESVIFLKFHKSVWASFKALTKYHETRST